MPAPEVSFQSAQPEHLPAVIDLLEREDMRDPRRDTTERLENVLAARPDAITVGLSKDREVVATAYLGDILPIVSGVVVRPDYRNMGVCKSLLDTTDRVAASMGHQYTEVVVSDRLKPYYERIGYSVTDECILMERPVSTSDEISALAPGHRPKRRDNRTFDYTNRYRPDVYHAAFSALLQTCIERPSMSYVQEDPNLAPLYKQKLFLSSLKSGSRIKGEMLLIDDLEIRKKGVYGWAALQDEGIDALKLLSSEANIEPTIWTPFQGQIDQGIYYVRTHNDLNEPITISAIDSSAEIVEGRDTPENKLRAPIPTTRTDHIRTIYKLPDTPTRLNFLVATAQKLMRDEFEMLE